MGTKGVDMLAALAAGQPLGTRRVTVDCPLLERSSV
jgi:LacI family transcriptional regulator